MSALQNACVVLTCTLDSSFPNQELENSWHFPTFLMFRYKTVQFTV